jgi:chromate reductase
MITLIAGTNRAGSRTKQIAQHVDAIYADLKVPRTVLDLATLPLEMFAPAAYAEKPPSFQPFAAAILQSTGLVVITPEYNGGIPGVLKYFIDLLKFPESFCKRPVCFVGLSAGQWGALRPVEQLQAIFGYRNAFIYPERVLVARVAETLDESGRLSTPCWTTPAT